MHFHIAVKRECEAMSRIRVVMMGCLLAAVGFSGLARASDASINLSTSLIAMDGGLFYVFSPSAVCGGRYAHPLAVNGGQQMFSLLMAAKLAGKTVSIHGSGACDQNDSEGIAIIFMP